MTGIVKDRRFLDHNYGAGHVEGPERLEAIYGMIEGGLPFPLASVEPRPALRHEIEYVHSPDYVNLIERTAGRRHVMLDADTSLTAKSYETALIAAGATMNAADAVLDGRIDNGFAFVRPPGHHAERDRGMGFCVFNNIAIAAEHLVRRRGLERVLIADWDLHHGNGTEHAFYDRSDVLFFSTHQFPYYPGTGYWDEVGAGAGEGFTVNVPLAPGKGDGDYLFIFRNILGPIAAAFRPEFILVSAGFDIYAADPLGGMNVTPDGFDGLASELLEMAQRLCHGRLLFVLEGGYDFTGLAEGSRRVLTRISGSAGPSLVKAEISTAARKEISPVFDVQKRYWPL